MTARECATCSFFGHERVGKGEVFGSCRVDGPVIGSRCIASATSIGDAWVGLWPFVPRDAWCGRYVADHKKRIATGVRVGTPTLED